jgi:hypothetical protein
MHREVRERIAASDLGEHHHVGIDLEQRLRRAPDLGERLLPLSQLRQSHRAPVVFRHALEVLPLVVIHRDEKVFGIVGADAKLGHGPSSSNRLRLLSRLP